MNAQSHTLVTNLNYRLTWGDLGELVPGPVESRRALRIQQGGDALLKDCLADSEKWLKDPLISRFGHGHPFSTIGCRERTSPSAHVVFYRKEDGTRQAWIHFDLYGPRNILGHATEVIRNRLTFGRTSQYDVYRSLVEHSTHDDIEVPSTRYDFASHLTQYLSSTFGPKPIASAMFSASVRSRFHSDGSKLTAHGFGAYGNHVAENLARRTIQQSIEFGAASLLQQEEAFTSSHEQQTGRRIRSALYHSFFVPGRNGDEFAFPRLAAAVGTSLIVSEWHPWQQEKTNPWLQTAAILSKYIARSFYKEYKPEVKMAIGKGKKLLKLN